MFAVRELGLKTGRSWGLAGSGLAQLPWKLQRLQASEKSCLKIMWRVTEEDTSCHPLGFIYAHSAHIEAWHVVCAPPHMYIHVQHMCTHTHVHAQSCSVCWEYCTPALEIVISFPRKSWLVHLKVLFLTSERIQSRSNGDMCSLLQAGLDSLLFSKPWPILHTVDAKDSSPAVFASWPLRNRRLV